MPNEEGLQNIKDPNSPTGADEQRIHGMHYGTTKLIFQKAEELRKFPTHE